MPTPLREDLSPVNARRENLANNVRKDLVGNQVTDHRVNRANVHRANQVTDRKVNQVSGLRGFTAKGDVQDRTEGLVRLVADRDSRLCRF